MYFEEKINQIVTRSSGLAIDVFYEIYVFINSLDLEQQYEAFCYMCENVKKCKLEEDNLIVIKEHFTEEKLDKYLPKLKKRFVEEIEHLIIDSSKTSVPTDVFYKKVWDLIQSNKICKTRHEKALATFIFVDNDLIPYTPVGTGVSMDEDEYNFIAKSIDSYLIKQTKMIMQMQYDQKTQKSSLIVEKMNNLSFKEKSVYLSMVFDMLEERIKDDLKIAIDNI